MSRFDKYASDYSARVEDAVDFSHCGHEFFLRAKKNHLIRALRRHGDPQSMRILDVGCGVGLMERELRPLVGRLVGTDVSLESLHTASRAESGDFLSYDGLRLPFADGAFDAVFAVCVLHHVAPANWDTLLREMNRVLRKSGSLMLYEHNPWNPLTRMVVNRCEFDRDATLLSGRHAARLVRRAGFSEVAVDYILFFPWTGRLWRSLEQRLHALALGAQYAALGRKI